MAESTLKYVRTLASVKSTGIYLNTIIRLYYVRSFFKFWIAGHINTHMLI